MITFRMNSGNPNKLYDMLEYYIMILNKLSFDPNLAHKEYRKSLRNLDPTDQQKLRKWAMDNLPHKEASGKQIGNL
ncbi:MAG: hypothetical protein RJQ14_08240 [Marinoscillum sp.]